MWRVQPLHQNESPPEAAQTAPGGLFYVVPRKVERLCGERTSSGVNEPCRLRRGERYAACEDAFANCFPGGFFGVREVPRNARVHFSENPLRCPFSRRLSCSRKNPGEDQRGPFQRHPKSTLDTTIRGRVRHGPKVPPPSAYHPAVHPSGQALCRSTFWPCHPAPPGRRRFWPNCTDENTS